MDKKKKVGYNEFIVLLFRFLLLIFIYALLRIAFYSFNYDLFPHVTLRSFSNLLYGGLRFDISALIYLNILFFVLYWVPFQNKFKSAYRYVINIVFFVFNTIGICANCVDIIYYRFILKRTSYDILESLKNEDNMVSLWSKFVVDYWYITILFVLFTIAFVLVTLKVKPKVTPIKNRWLYAIYSLAMMAIVIGLSIAGIRGGFRHSTRPITLSNAAAYTVNPEEAAIVLNTPFSIIRTIGKTGLKKLNYYSSNKELESVYTPIHQPQIDSTKTSPNKKNVVVFIMESFSREFIGCMNKSLDNGNYRGYTPFLDSLAQHSLVFSNAYANGRKSIDAMPSVLASIPSLTMPYVVSAYSSNPIDGLARVLNNYGYESSFFHGAPNGSMGFDGFAKIAGFDRYFGKNEYNNDEDYDGIWGIWDDKFFQFYANQIHEMNQPFFVSLFSLSSHHPFKVPQQFEGKFPKGNLPVEECIGYSDNALRMFFDNAKQQPWFNNTIFVITADHSIQPDHNEYKNSINAFAIPIFIYAPGDSTIVGTDNQLAQQIDIMPTILNYLNIETPYLAFGNNLFDNQAKRFVINYQNEYQYMQDDLVLYFDGVNITNVFNYKQDPMLTQNIIDKCDYKDAERHLRAVLQQYNNRMIDNQLSTK